MAGEAAPFTPEVSSSETSQAQHQLANDAPVDVNVNAILGRFQGGTYALMGANFEAAAARRNGILDHLMLKLAKEVPGP